MPSQSQQGGLFKKLGNKLAKGLKTHGADETTISGGQLPDGIEDGRAQLADCRFAVYKKGPMKGEYYFMASGIVTSPERVNGRKIAGLRTSIGPEPLCDTPKRSRETTEDHLAWVLNEIRKLGFDTKPFTTGELGPDDLESVAATLMEAKPSFAFRTWKGEATKEFPNSRINHSWEGVVEEDGQAIDPDAGVTEEATSEPEAEPEAEPEVEQEDNGLDALAEKADSGDKKAQVAMDKRAAAAGVESEAAEAPSYADAVEIIRAAEAGAGSESEPEAEPEEFKPEKGEVYLYRPLDVKTKKPVKTPVECSVEAVFKNETVNLKNLDDGKTIYKAVPFSKLEQAG